jgi:plastocyanin
MKKRITLTLTFLALAAAGCGGDDEEEPAGNGGGGGGGGGGGAAEVSMENVQFSPQDITVGAGETITFTNNESIPHDVQKTSGPGDEFSSGPSGGMQQGDTFELTLDEAGEYEYVCNVHAPGMTGTITVE